MPHTSTVWYFEFYLKGGRRFGIKDEVSCRNHQPEMDPTFQSGNIRHKVLSEEKEGGEKTSSDGIASKNKSLTIMWHGTLHLLITQLQPQKSLFYLYTVIPPQTFKAMWIGSKN